MVVTGANDRQPLPGTEQPHRVFHLYSLILSEAFSQTGGQTMAM
jgi:hypothetical protein